MSDSERWDNGIKTISTKDALKVVENLKIEGYKLLKDREGHKENFFIWRKLKKGKEVSEYLRVVLIPPFSDKRNLFYWNLEKSFKPFLWRHNLKMTEEGQNNIKSKGFESNSEEYLIQLKEIIKLI